MTPRILYFFLGAASTCALFAGLLLWDSYHDFKVSSKSERMIQQRLRPAEKLRLRLEELAGRWRGKESWGTTFTITRRLDGTFSEITDNRQSDVGHPPFIINSTGRWSVSGSHYAFYYTQSSEQSRVDRGPIIIDIHEFTPTYFTYQTDEGNGCTERKR